MSVAGKSRLVRDISANTLQSLVTQVAALVIFYFTSRYLPKSEFGDLNWCLALASTVLAIGTLGLDLVFVRKVAAGENPMLLGGLHFFHTVITGVVVVCGAWLGTALFSQFGAKHPVLLLVFIHLAVANVANSFKLFLNGLERYKVLAIIALLINALRLGGMVALYFTETFSLFSVVLLYLLCSAAELVVAYVTLSPLLPEKLLPLYRPGDYKYFILESLPQLGVVVFDSALARIDWILLGVMSTVAITADYSFTYRVFEVSKLPLLIIAPVLLTRFSRILREEGRHVTGAQRRGAELLLTTEMFFLNVIPMLIAVCWTPVIDTITQNKYGAVNEKLYWVLALCVPVAGLVNYLWTLAFALGKLRTILLVTVSSSVLNIVFNLVLIPAYGAMGSALSYLLSSACQLLLYALLVKQNHLPFSAWRCLFPALLAMASAVVGRMVSGNVIFAAPCALLLYVALGALTRQLKVKETLVFLGIGKGREEAERL